ncbi:clan AA aspartic protease [Egbenema bharatensis]|uniref:clan AA aspartic protease n=1 Tax=Egbenema bharatensis TaxID=3463334 RepID=UPI003A87FDE3
MMLGVVNANCEATIRLVIGNANAQRQVIDAVIDTGFTGFLSLPSHLISALTLPWIGIDRGTLGDGSEATFNVYEANIIWDGQSQNIPINAAETDPLVGMSLLYGYNLQIQAIEGGMVKIEVLSP